MPIGYFKQTLLLGLCAGLSLHAPAAAATTVVDFEELAHSDPVHRTPGPQFTSGGLAFSASIDQATSYLVWSKNSPFNADKGGATIGHNRLGMTSTVTLAAGGLFDLMSIGLAEFDNSTGFSTIELAFIRPNKPVEKVEVTLARMTGLSVFNFDQRRIAAFSIRPVTSNRSVQFDEIAYRPHLAGVPEPATWALMIGGFGLAGASLRRSRRGQVYAARLA